MHNGDDLNFSIGFSSSSFSLDNFFMSPRCGCRLNCDDEDNDEFRVRNDSSSAVSSRTCDLQ
ncbi:hypothetical protein HN873_025532, partial [Arachis hypogaea]